MKIKDKYPIKYHYHIYQKLKTYPTEYDFDFDILYMILDYNTKKRRKKIKAEFKKVDLVTHQAKLSEPVRIEFDDFLDKILKKYNGEENDNGIIVLDKSFLEEYLD